MWAGLIVFMGEAAEEIVALAQEFGSRGVAIGSHGLTAKQSIFLGSVAYKVVHLSKVPVLIVR
jgi:nucleotide-binding universal stress UspA family protein